MQYYLHDGNSKSGPFTLEQLSQQELKRSYLVWRDGLKDWLKITELSELSEILKNVPPEYASTVTPPPAPQKEKEIRYLTIEKKNNDWLVWLLFIALALAFGFLLGINTDAEEFKNSF